MRSRRVPRGTGCALAASTPDAPDTSHGLGAAQHKPRGSRGSRGRACRPSRCDRYTLAAVKRWPEIRAGMVALAIFFGLVDGCPLPPPEHTPAWEQNFVEP